MTTGISGGARIALIGAGSIAASYVRGFRATPGFEIACVCSLTGDGAHRLAQAEGLTAASIDDVAADPEIDYVINLTPAVAHGDITRRFLEAGKSVYSEKPLAATLAEADALIALAEARKLLLACAPATFLWPPLATARRIVAEGELGSISGALITLVYPGPELFHEHPAHLYSALAGPLFDMGVYQVTALVALLGPVTSVSAMTSQARSERQVLVGPDAGRKFAVEAPTHVHAQMAHNSGAISNLIVSFDATSASEPRLDVYGAAGGLSVARWHAPDAALTVKRPGSPAEPFASDGPGWTAAMAAIGATQAWTAHRAGSAVEASAQRARATLKVLLAAIESAAHQRIINVTQ